MSCISAFLLFLLPFLSKRKHRFLFREISEFSSVVNSEICHEQIRLNGRQEKSSAYCSSCSTYIDEQISAPIIQLELPVLSRLTGIYVQHDQNNSVRQSEFYVVSFEIILHWIFRN